MKNDSNWVSLSDMMTGLMLVFLLISILTISHVVKAEKARESMLVDFDMAKSELYEDLQKILGDKKSEWGVEVSRDLSIKFDNPDVLFEYLSAEITPEFKVILDEFIPLYIDIVNNQKYEDKIKEVRIEGHTGTWSDYMYTIQLSQSRANSVLAYILSSDHFKKLDTHEQERLKFLLTANGLGNGRMIDADGEYIYYSKKESEINSRRVEFRIITTSDELVDEIINNSINQ